MNSAVEDLAFEPSVASGIDRLLFAYANLQAGDDVVVVYTPEVRDSVALVCLRLRSRGFAYSVVPMRALSDGAFRGRLESVVPRTRTKPGKIVALVFEWETMSQNKTFRDVFSGHRPDQRTIVRCINTGRDLFAVGLLPEPSELSRRNADLLHFIRHERSLHISTKGGTSLSVSLDPDRFAWISNRGMSEGGRMIALPGGEVATFPARIDGVLVADFAINVNYRFAGDARLAGSPVTVRIENGEIRDWDCQDPRIQSQLAEFFRMPNATRVGELGFGTHPAVGDAVPENSHLNERRMGVHIGFGQHNQDPGNAGYDAQIHVDLIASGGLLALPDGRTIDLEAIPSSGAEHPGFLKSVDLFSPDVVPPDISPPDCCGMNVQ